MAVYSIVNEEPNAQECKARIKEYEEQFKSDIVIRQSQRADSERSTVDQIAKELRDLEHSRTERLWKEATMKQHKQQYKQELTQVQLGERDEVSAELKQAMMQGYYTYELKRATKGAGAAVRVTLPHVREPLDGLHKDPNMNRELYQKRQAAGGGIPSGSIVVHERNWNEAVSSLLFSRVSLS